MKAAPQAPLAPPGKDQRPASARLWPASAQLALALAAAVLFATFLWKAADAGPVPRPSQPLLVDINRAGPAELELLPGIGLKTAQAIVEHRQTHGPFRQADDLQNVAGIGKFTWPHLAKHVVVGPFEATPNTPRPAAPDILRINVNRADAADLERLPGIGRVLAQRIVEHRGVKGAFGKLEDLRGVRGIGPKTLAKIKPHIDF